MRTLSSYVIERLNPRHLGSIKGDKFPVDGTLNEIIEFLKRQGYEEYFWFSQTPKDWIRSFNDHHEKCFFYNPKNAIGYEYIKFANTSETKISKNHPIYQICIEPSTNTKSYAILIPNHDSIDISKDYFIREIDTYFE